MIRLIQIEHREMTNLTSWCKMCYNTGQVAQLSTCAVCQGFLTTFIECPRCGKKEEYNGHAAPDNCIVCKQTFPDLNRLKESEKERVSYSIGELC